MLDRYLQLLDSAPVGGNSLFKDHEDKARHESLLNYGLRKLQASLYHLENVNRLIASQSRDYATAHRVHDLEPFHAGATGARIVVHSRCFVRTNAEPYIYELAAFLEAAKSSLDFLATAFSGYLPGVEADSIQTLIRMAEPTHKRAASFELNAVKRHLPWLKELRDYRHHLVHRMVVTASSGHETHREGTITSLANMPVVVPKSTPSYYPDTRLARLTEDLPRGLSVMRSRASFTTSDGHEEVVDYTIRYEPSPGYIRIEDFMTRHFDTLTCFFADLTTDAISLGFCTRGRPCAGKSAQSGRGDPSNRLPPADKSRKPI